MHSIKHKTFISVECTTIHIQVSITSYVSCINWTYKSAKVSKDEGIQIGLVPTTIRNCLVFAPPTNQEREYCTAILLQIILCTFLFLLVLSKYCWVEATLNPQAHYLIIWWARKVFLKIFFWYMRKKIM